MEVAEEVARVKPIIMVKSGTTAAGAKAAASHTGSLAGSDAAYDAAFHQSGVLRARTVQEYVRLCHRLRQPAAAQGQAHRHRHQRRRPGHPLLRRDREDGTRSLLTIAADTEANLRTRVSRHGQLPQSRSTCSAMPKPPSTNSPSRPCWKTRISMASSPSSPRKARLRFRDGGGHRQHRQDVDKPILTCFMGGTLDAAGGRSS